MGGVLLGWSTAGAGDGASTGVGAIGGESGPMILHRAELDLHDNLAGDDGFAALDV